MLTALIAALVILNAILLSLAIGLLLAMTARAIRDHDRRLAECGYDPHAEPFGEPYGEQARASGTTVPREGA